jgi:hypothetical protein
MAKIRFDAGYGYSILTIGDTTNVITTPGEILLDGSMSTDDYRITSYRWTKRGLPRAVFSRIEGINTNLRIPFDVKGDSVEVQLEVTDAFKRTSTAKISFHLDRSSGLFIDTGNPCRQSFPLKKLTPDVRFEVGQIEGGRIYQVETIFSVESNPDNVNLIWDSSNLLKHGILTDYSSEYNPDNPNLLSSVLNLVVPPSVHTKELVYVNIGDEWCSRKIGIGLSFEPQKTILLVDDDDKNKKETGMVPRGINKFMQVRISTI